MYVQLCRREEVCTEVLNYFAFVRHDKKIFVNTSALNITTVVGILLVSCLRYDEKLGFSVELVPRINSYKNVKIL